MPNAAIGAGGMFHKQPAAEFSEGMPPAERAGSSSRSAASALAESGAGKPREFRVAVDAFRDLMSGGPE